MKHNLDLAGPPFFLVAELPERADRDFCDVGREIVALDRDAVAPAQGQPAGPLARRVVGVVNDQPAAGRQGRLEMEGVTRMLLDSQVEAPHRQDHRKSIALDRGSPWR